MRDGHCNIQFGRYLLAIRGTHEDPPNYKPPFIDVGFGRGMLKSQQKWDAMTVEERNMHLLRQEERQQAMLRDYFTSKETKNDGNT